MDSKRMNGKNHFYMDTHSAANAKRFFFGDERPTRKRRKTKSPNLYLWRNSRRNIWTCALVAMATSAPAVAAAAAFSSDENKKVFVLAVINLEVLLFSAPHTGARFSPLIFKFVCSIRYAAISIRTAAAYSRSRLLKMAFVLILVLTFIRQSLASAMNAPRLRYTRRRANKMEKQNSESDGKQIDTNTVQWTSSWRKDPQPPRRSCQVKVISTFRAVRTMETREMWMKEMKTIYGREQASLENSTNHDQRAIQHTIGSDRGEKERERDKSVAFLRHEKNL